ncbi:MAG: hypothetical protein ABSA08_00810 [Acidimicrobiales bacterium]|jgi:hypothetical protein
MRPDVELIADPTRLAEVVAEVARFTRDPRRVAEGVLELADALGIEEAVADRIVEEALRGLRRSDADVG